MSRVDPSLVDVNYGQAAGLAQNLGLTTPLQRAQVQSALQDQQAQVAERQAQVQRLMDAHREAVSKYNEGQALKQLMSDRQAAGKPITANDFTTVAPINGAEWGKAYFANQEAENKIAADQLANKQKQFADAQSNLDAIAEQQRLARGIPQEERMKRVQDIVGNLFKTGKFGNGPDAQAQANAMLDPQHWTDESLDEDIKLNHAAVTAQIKAASDQNEQNLKLAQTAQANATAQKDAAQGKRLEAGLPENVPTPTDRDKEVLEFNKDQELTAKYGTGIIGLKKYEQAQAVDKAVAQAKATAPIKIETAAGTAAAQANAGGQAGIDLMAEQALNGQFTSRNAVLLGKVYQRAAELAKERGLSNTGVIMAQNAAKASRQALDTLTNQQAQVEAFSQTASKNMQTLESAMKDVTDLGAPFLNTPIRNLQAKYAGNAKVTAFNAALQPVQTEIAKILNSSNASGMLTDSARHEMESALGPGTTPSQLKAALDVFRTDIENRRSVYKAQIEDLKGQTAVGNKDNSQKATHRFNPATGKIELIQ